MTGRIKVGSGNPCTENQRFVGYATDYLKKNELYFA